ncbi:MAG: hypothetical protein OMM_14872, partial [Candidatus Magnetoglobus multicellularis str. Araruama]
LKADNAIDTDSVIKFGWMGNILKPPYIADWPNQALPAHLVTLKFIIKNMAITGITPVNITFSSLSTGYEGQSTNAQINITSVYHGQHAFTQTIKNNQSCSPSVLIEITPKTQTQSYAVESYLPIGMIPVQITDNGIWFESKQAVMWGTFQDDNVRALSYAITGTTNDAFKTIHSVASFDGYSQLSVDSQEIIHDCSLQQVQPSVFSPVEGSIPLTITISCPTEGVSIYYSNDGSIPDINAYLYEAPL